MAYRKDRNITREIPVLRRILSLLIPGPHKNQVFMEQKLDLSRTLPWIEAERARTGKKIQFLHLFMAGTGRMLHRYPRLNRYVSGFWFYQRDGVTISVSAKKEMKDGAKVVLLKIPLEADETPARSFDRMVTALSPARAGTELAQEKEVRAFMHIPSLIFYPLLVFIRWLHNLHLLPGWFMDPDPMFTSIVVANLGSVGMNSAFHHLYSWGNAHFFAVIGRIRDEVVLVDGKVEVHPVADIKYTFDDRVEDGLACGLGLANLKELLEDPERFASGFLTDFDGRPPPSVSL